MGKGDRYRKVDQERYARNYDQIFSKRMKQPMSVQTFEEFGDRCLSTWRGTPTSMCPHMYTVLAINGEAGELAEEVKKLHRDANGVMDIDRRIVWLLNSVTFCIILTGKPIVSASHFNRSLI